MQKFAVKMLKNKYFAINVPDGANLSDGDMVLVRTEKGEEVAKKVIGTARIIRNCLPNATYIGFTGTPIALKDRSTREVFGDYISDFQKQEDDLIFKKIPQINNIN